MVKIDWFILIFYFVVVSLYGYWIYKRKKQKEASSADFFIAEGTLSWWAIGASLIASNISAEQMTGMSGSGFQLGLAISSYEWMAALTLIIVAVFFMPVYLKNKIFTMPQFLNQRYNSKVAMAMAIFWLLLYIVVNLLSILYLGAVAIAGISGLDFTLCVFLLAVFSIFIALGGMKVVGYTSAIQVFFLVVSGFIVLFIALKMIGGDDGIFAGFKILRAEASDHFHMIFKKDNPNYIDLPGMSVLLGGMWIANLNYWGCNQYITQRALGASLPVARKGILFAAFLKMLMPFIIVLPGIAMYYLHEKGIINKELIGTESNRTYSALLTLLPDGIKGVTIAAFAATVVASLAAKVNSISTIFTLDIYKKAFKTDASESELVKIGKIAIIISTAIGILLTLGLGDSLMGEGKQGFQYIQEYTGFVSPGIFAMFLLGFFWKKTTSNAALFATIGGFIFSVLLKFLPGMIDLEPLYSVGLAVPNAAGVFEIPFLDRMGIVFLLCIVGMYIISIIENKRGVKPNSLEIDASMFKTSTGFAIGSMIIIGLLVALYTMFW
ncbi:MAG TPA: sodium/solute symporter [Chitinophagaceae bacterium]|nr:sodium/solute symporter [Chitinophagaceae bacterium]HNU14439.1 sodium/solute symporter [Chitinophagaceae bacterium]